MRGCVLIRVAARVHVGFFFVHTLCVSVALVLAFTATFCFILCVFHVSEYLIHTGYIKKDIVPARYTAIEPELVLKANNVVTGEIVDPAFRLCADKAAGHVSVVISLTDTSKITSALKKRGLAVEIPSVKEIQDAETAAGAVDTPWVSTPLSTPLLQSQIVEAGWR